MLCVACLLALLHISPALAQDEMDEDAAPPAATAAAPAPAPAAAQNSDTPAAAVPAPPDVAPAHSSAGVISLFTVSDVKVDITADSAAHARDKAFAEAEKQAFSLLASRLSGQPPHDWKIGDTEIARLVRDVELTSERTSAVRYIGTFEIRFNPDAVKSYLGDANIQIMAKAAPQTLLLPVLVTDGHGVLWEQTTGWRSAWDKEDTAHDLVPLILPQGTIEDATAISTPEVIAGNEAALAHIAQNYNAAQVVVALLQAPAPGAKQANLSLTLWRDADGSGLFQPHPIRSAFALPAPAAGPDDPVALAACVAETRALLASDWKQAGKEAQAPQAGAPPASIAATAVPPQTAEDSGLPPASISASAPITGMADWIALRRRLESASAVQKFDINGLNRARADLTLHFRGDIPRLAASLAASGLTLEQAAPGSWQIRAAALAPQGADIPVAPEHGVPAPAPRAAPQ